MSKVKLIPDRGKPLALATFVVAVTALLWGSTVASGRAQPVAKAAQAVQKNDAAALELRKSTLQKRQEAKKRLEEEIEARKVRKLSGQDAASGGKGVGQ